MTCGGHMGLAMKTVLFLAIAVVAQAAGNVCLAIGIKPLAVLASFDPGAWPTLVAAALSNPWLWAGTVLLIIFTVLFTLVLSWADLSLAMPVVSVEVVVNVALAAWLLGERVEPLHWAGVALVAGGVALVADSARPPVATATISSCGEDPRS
ncbi:EamA domain-containing protein [uncultured Gammaproteobacteria bacterium]